MGRQERYSLGDGYIDYGSRAIAPWVEAAKYKRDRQDKLYDTMLGAAAQSKLITPTIPEGGLNIGGMPWERTDPSLAGGDRLVDTPYGQMKASEFSALMSGMRTQQQIGMDQMGIHGLRQGIEGGTVSLDPVTSDIGFKYGAKPVVADKKRLFGGKAQPQVNQPPKNYNELVRNKDVIIKRLKEKNIRTQSEAVQHLVENGIPQADAERFIREV